MTKRRDVAVVLSGGGMNGVLMEHGFMLRLRESSLWPRVGWIFGTSAGALVGSMAALERLDELEAFLLGLEPDETFRPNRLWQLPFLGLNEYALPDTIQERFGDLTEIAREAGRVRPRGGRLRDRRVAGRPRARHPRLRARLLLAPHGARDDGAGDPRLGGDQRARPAGPRRGPDRDRRRVGAELPARARVRAPGRQADRGVSRHPA